MKKEIAKLGNDILSLNQKEIKTNVQLGAALQFHDDFESIKDDSNNRIYLIGRLLDTLIYVDVNHTFDDTRVYDMGGNVLLETDLNVMEIL